MYGSASEEEKRLTMMLFSNIFESLSQMVGFIHIFYFFPLTNFIKILLYINAIYYIKFFQEYDPDLFSKALPCLSAIGCALPPDYSLSAALDGDLFRSYANESEGPYNPVPIDTSM